LMRPETSTETLVAHDGNGSCVDLIMEAENPVNISSCEFSLFDKESTHRNRSGRKTPVNGLVDAE